MTENTQLSSIEKEVHEIRTDVAEVKTNMKHYSKNLDSNVARVDKVEEQVKKTEIEIVSLRQFGHLIEVLTSSFESMDENIKYIMRKQGKEVGRVDNVERQSEAIKGGTTKTIVFVITFASVFIVELAILIIGRLIGG